MCLPPLLRGGDGLAGWLCATAAEATLAGALPGPASSPLLPVHRKVFAYFLNFNFV